MLRRLLVILLGTVLVAVPSAAGGRARQLDATAASLALAPTAGPPTSKSTASGSGFAPGERVNLFFDGAAAEVATAGPSGGFAGVTIVIPASALPGSHTISAVGRTSGRAARLGFLVRANWPSVGADASHRGSNRTENVLSPANVSGLRSDWVAAVGLPCSGCAERFSPVVANGVVYTGSSTDPTVVESILSAVEADTGALRWSKPVRGHIQPPAVEHAAVYVSSFQRARPSRLYAFGAVHGSRRWLQELPAVPVSPPVVANGLVYVQYGLPQTGKGTLSAYQASTGALRWSVQIDALETDKAVAVADGIVYTTTDLSALLALDATSGALLWSKAVGTIASTPAVANGRLYLGTLENRIVALDAHTGAEIWSEFLNGPAGSSPTVARGVVYLATTYVDADTSELDAYNAATGTLLWATTTTHQTSSTSLAVANGVLYVGDDGSTFSAFDTANGSLLWHRATGGHALSSPAVANGMVYVSADDGTIYAYSLGPG